MSHTDSDLFIKNNIINRYVGGGSQKRPLKDSENYINNQVALLDSQNSRLYPNVRYGQRSPDNYDTYNQPSRNTFVAPQQNGACCGKNENIIPTLNAPKINNNSQGKQDTYLLKENDKYDPYTGYLYDHGLLNDGNQKRRLLYNYVDINSSFRRKKSVITVGDEFQLSSDPLTFGNGSNLMHINIDPTTFNVNDPITLTNVVSKFAILRTVRGTLNGQPLPAFEILPGFNFMKIWFDHHIPKDYPSSRTTIQIKIGGIMGYSNNPNTVPTLLGNVPISTINTVHTLKLTLTASDVTGDISSILLQDPTYFDYSPHYFFIILPIGLQMSASYVLLIYNFNILFNSLEAIPLNTINTSSQINPNQLSSFHTIKSIDSTGIIIELPFTAITDTDSQNNNTGTINGGGNFIILGHVSGIDVGYPDPNSYKVSLPAVYNNVVSIKLVSSEIPNANKTIRDFPPESANNKLYWNDIDDGDYLYSISVPAGNYTPADLITALSVAFASVPRINSNADATYTSTHFIQTAINLNTNEVTFTPYKEFILPQVSSNGTVSPGPITVIEVIIGDQDPVVLQPSDPVPQAGATYRLTIYQPNNGVSLGQTILIQNAVDDSRIPASVINGTHAVTSVIDQNTYTIDVSKFNSAGNPANTSGGGNVFIYVSDIARFRFDQPNTLGTVLGFRNPGDPLSITPYASVISNAIPYAEELSTNILGQTIDVTNNALQFAGDNYMIMNAFPIQIYESISAIKSPFAKIILCDSPGKILYNSFVSMTQLYENPISTLSDLTIEFFTPDGALVNFDGLDHSFTLEIVTVSDIPANTRINANTGKNYNQSI